MKMVIHDVADQDDNRDDDYDCIRKMILMASMIMMILSASMISMTILMRIVTMTVTRMNCKVLSNQGDSGVTPETLSQVEKVQNQIVLEINKDKPEHHLYHDDQARVFVIPGPREKFSETEINHMKKYLEVGSHLRYDPHCIISSNIFIVSKMCFAGRWQHIGLVGGGRGK